MPVKVAVFDAYGTLLDVNAAMLDEAVAAAEIKPWLDAVLSVDAIGVYKPDPRVYRLAEDRFGLRGSATELRDLANPPYEARFT